MIGVERSLLVGECSACPSGLLEDRVEKSKVPQAIEQLKQSRGEKSSRRKPCLTSMHRKACWVKIKAGKGR